MPQQDRHKDRTIPIEFDFYDTLTNLPVEQRCTVTLLTCGSATVKINDHIRLLQSPCVICLSKYDSFSVIHTENLSAKSFHFDPWYIKACLAFENLDDEVEIDKSYEYDRMILYMFTQHSGSFQGILNLTPQNYIHLNELMLMIGAETYAQSCGFKYDTYFIRQFTKKMGISPATYRKNPLSYSAFEGSPLRKL